MTTFEQKRGRPKPPPVNDCTHPLYQDLYPVFAVLREGRTWSVYGPNNSLMTARTTHAEAIACAHTHANERNPS